MEFIATGSDKTSHETSKYMLTTQTHNTPLYIAKCEILFKIQKVKIKQKYCYYVAKELPFELRFLKVSAHSLTFMSF